MCLFCLDHILHPFKHVGFYAEPDEVAAFDESQELEALLQQAAAKKPAKSADGNSA